MPPRTAAPKIQRWIDLLAALLKRHYLITFEEIAREVPAYKAKGAKKDTVMRMFERDKDELRAFGIPIETVLNEDDGAHTGYKLAAKEFYLPYLCLRADAGGKQSTPKKLIGHGYGALDELVFDADELDAIAQAGAIVQTLGDPVLADEIASALRKLAFDMPIAGIAAFAEAQVSARPMVLNRVIFESSRTMAVEELEAVFDSAAPRRAFTPPRDHFEQISQALTRRKTVRFTYFSMHRGETSERSAEPYGMFFTGSQWYVAARDTASGEVKSFRVSRITKLEIETARPQQPDYEIPADFTLSEYARTRQPWELGQGDAMQVTVEFSGESGATAAASRLGLAVRGAAKRRAFSVRRPDAFARWLLSFGGEAKVVSPPALRTELRAQLERTMAIYGGDDDR